MPTVSDAAAHWDERIARARELAGEQESAREVLTFYAGLADFQRALFRTTSPARAEPASDFADTVNLAQAAAAVPEFLHWLQRAAPAPLAQAAAELHATDPREWRQRFREYLAEDADAGEGREAVGLFLVEAVVHPFAEAAAIAWRRDGRASSHAPGDATARCPICAGRPIAGVLREEGHGAKRTLVCGRCLTEWQSLRVSCPACAEQQFDALPVYTAEEFPHARVDACDTCKRYVKTIDLTKNALAVPLVDDLASLPLDLWAQEQGYRRLRANLLQMPQ